MPTGRNSHTAAAHRDNDDARFQAAMRRRASKRLGDDATLELARQCSLQLSQRLIQQARLTDPSQPVSFVNSDDDDNDDDGNSSVASSKTDYSNERAVLRGVRMGSFETRERNNTRDSDLQSEFAASTIGTDMNTEAEDTVSRLGLHAVPPPSRSQAPLLKVKRKRRWGKGSRSGSVASSTVASESEAWMCGVCGKAFATYEACDRHEAWHIQVVCTNLVGDDNNNDTGGRENNNASRNDLLDSQTVSSETRERFQSTRQRLFTEEEPSSATQTIASATSKSERRLPTQLHMGVPWQRRRNQQQLPKDNDEDVISKEPWEVDGASLMELPASKRSHHEVHFNEYITDEDGDSNALLTSSSMNEYLLLSDEALVTVCKRAQPLLLTKAEMAAERNLALLARDKAYYDDLAMRAIVRRKNPYNRFRSDGDTMRDKVHNKLLDAYQIMKQGDNTRGMTDQYNKLNAGNDKDLHAMNHSNNTLYVNVMVKNSVQVVKRELERLAKERWERPEGETDETISKFQRFRVYAHVNMVKLAGLALASDFTPRRIAIQLSNDLYRLLSPRLKRRGVAIETEIEYRVGGYFVLAVNINAIDWLQLMKANVVDVTNRMRRWKREDALRNEDVKAKTWFWHRWYMYVRQVLFLTWFDVLTRALSLLYHFHWSISIPICWLAYHSPLATTIRMFILSSVTDEIFYYVEQKGMEMEICVLQANSQASFMLQALREIRAGGRELKKKRQETEAQEVGVILGNLLGPPIKADKDPAPPLPEGFAMPADLEFVSLEVELPVGFRRLRWAILSDASTFVSEAVMKTEAKYEIITINPWERYCEHIGNAVLPDDVKPDEFVGVTKEQEYLMPKSAFVSANMAYDTVEIIAYNDACFAIKKKSTYSIF